MFDVSIAKFDAVIQIKPSIRIEKMTLESVGGTFFLDKLNLQWIKQKLSNLYRNSN